MVPPAFYFAVAADARAWSRQHQPLHVDTRGVHLADASVERHVSFGDDVVVVTGVVQMAVSFVAQCNLATQGRDSLSSMYAGGK